ncbi:MAG: hypothetical protein H0V54_15930 [Chthoniobacterales bacterium]|nr:hypothetical protein [Chthoniobacterales bacterium]
MSLNGGAPFQVVVKLAQLFDLAGRRWRLPELPHVQKLVPLLWFDGQSEEAALQLRNSAVTDAKQRPGFQCGLRKWPPAGGSVMTIAVELVVDLLAKNGVVALILPRMPPELRVALCTWPLTRKSLREIGALLPEDDAQLLVWIEEAMKRADSDEMVKLLYAAAIAGRKLPASLIAEHGLGWGRVDRRTSALDPAPPGWRCARL